MASQSRKGILLELTKYGSRNEKPKSLVVMDICKLKVTPCSLVPRHDKAGTLLELVIPATSIPKWVEVRQVKKREIEKGK